MRGGIFNFTRVTFEGHLKKKVIEIVGPFIPVDRIWGVSYAGQTRTLNSMCDIDVRVDGSRFRPTDSPLCLTLLSILNSLKLREGLGHIHPDAVSLQRHPRRPGEPGTPSGSHRGYRVVAGVSMAGVSSDRI